MFYNFDNVVIMRGQLLPTGFSYYFTTKLKTIKPTF